MDRSTRDNSTRGASPDTTDILVLGRGRDISIERNVCNSRAVSPENGTQLAGFAVELSIIECIMLQRLCDRKGRNCGYAAIIRGLSLAYRYAESAVPRIAHWRTQREIREIINSDEISLYMV